MKLNMLHSSSMVVFLVAILVVSPSHTKADGKINPLLPFCKTVGSGTTYFSIDFCLSALGSDNRSRDNDGYQNFSIIAVDLVAANATSTGAKIGDLLKRGGKDDATKESLKLCQVVYRGIVDQMPACAAAVKGGQFARAVPTLEKAASAAKECEGQFPKRNVASPLTVEDDNAFKLAKLAVALIGFAH